MKKLLFCAIAAATATAACAQTITIRKVELVQEKIVVHYDLEDSNPNNEYLLNLYASKDNFSAPLSKVRGDIGIDIKPGAGKKVEWSIRDEYGGYKGKLALEVRGKVYTPFVRLQGFNTKKSYKRGKGHNLNWKVGNSNPVNIELYKGSQRVGGDMNHPNNGSYTLFIPAKAQPGKDYRLKISDARNTEEVIYTDLFRVTPKVPLLLKVLPIAAAGVVAVLILTKPKPPDDDPTDEESNIADPDFPTGN